MGKKTPDQPSMGFGLWRESPGRLPFLRAQLQGPVRVLEPEVGKGSQGRAGLGCRAGPPCPCGGTTERVTSVGPAQEAVGLQQGWAPEGGGHPASLSLAQLHFQKFLPPSLGLWEGRWPRGTGFTELSRARLELWGFRLGQRVGPSQRCQKN